ncbi:MAG TPA: hypothetical protein VGC76_10815 [Pyrinomonadaceae bacterium]|jgi:hypothetical protein
MNKYRFAIQAFVLVNLFFVFSAIADAQSARTWVSGVGDDLNPCSRSAPCKTFAVTITRTSVGGEINCIDPGGFGAVTITKSVTIDCEDTQGTISATVSTGIIVNITDPADTAKTVRLRGLSINGFGTGTIGVKVIAGNKLVLEQVVIDGFTSHGVSIQTSSGAFSFVAKDTTIRNNTGNGINTFLTGAATTTVSVEDSLLIFNGIGLNQGSATTGTIKNSGITNNTTGIQASSSTSILGVKDCVIAHNGTGILAGSSAVIRIGSNIITANTTGLSGSNIYTWDGNFVEGNTTNGSNNGGAAVQ